MISRMLIEEPAEHSQRYSLFVPVCAIRFRLLQEAALNVSLFERNLRGVS